MNSDNVLKTGRQSRAWTGVGMVIAFAAMPAVLALFNQFHVQWTIASVLLREAVLFGFAGALILVVHRGEGLGWESVGLQRPKFGGTALWILFTLVLVVIAAALAFGVIRLCVWTTGRDGPGKYDALPVWILALVILRAGFIEELYYRGYLIERLQTFTGSRIIAAGLPLLVFSACHYEQGRAGITIALFTGAALTGVYLYKRNLWITIVTHFLVDFVPNVLAPFLVGDSGVQTP